MQKSFRHFVATLVLLLVAGSAMAQSQLVIEGTGDSQQLLRQLATAFEALNPGTQVVVPDSIGSAGGIKSLVKGKSDMARVARPLKDQERALAADLVYREFAYSPVVFAANLPDKCIKSLTTDQIVGIFSGAISDWSKLGHCRTNKIYVALREEGDSSRAVLESKIPEFKAIPQLAGKILYSTPEAVQTIEEHPFTIGFLPQAATGPNMLTLAFNGIVPGEATVLSGSYPLVAPLGLVWKGQLSGLGARFLAFIFSPEGEKIIRGAAAVPVSGQK